MTIFTLVLFRCVIGGSLDRPSDVAHLVSIRFTTLHYRFKDDPNPVLVYKLPTDTFRQLRWFISSCQDPIIRRLVNVVIASCKGNLFEQTARTEQAVFLLAKRALRMVEES